MKRWFEYTVGCAVVGLLACGGTDPARPFRVILRNNATEALLFSVDVEVKTLRRDLSEEPPIEASTIFHDVNLVAGSEISDQRLTVFNESSIAITASARVHGATEPFFESAQVVDAQLASGYGYEAVLANGTGSSLVVREGTIVREGE